MPKGGSLASNSAKKRLKDYCSLYAKVIQSLSKLHQFDVQITNIFVDEIISFLHTLACEKHEAAGG